MEPEHYQYLTSGLMVGATLLGLVGVLYIDRKFREYEEKKKPCADNSGLLNTLRIRSSYLEIALHEISELEKFKDEMYVSNFVLHLSSSYRDVVREGLYQNNIPEDIKSELGKKFLGEYRKNAENFVSVAKSYHPDLEFRILY